MNSQRRHATLGEVGRALGISRGRAWQIEQKALCKLRNRHYSKALAEFTDDDTPAPSYKGRIRPYLSLEQLEEDVAHQWPCLV